MELSTSPFLMAPRHSKKHWRSYVVGGGCKCTHKNQDFTYKWLIFTMQAPSNFNIKQAWTPTGASFAPPPLPKKPAYMEGWGA
jgi:hypothetical protein